MDYNLLLPRNPIPYLPEFLTRLTELSPLRTGTTHKGDITDVMSDATIRLLPQVTLMDGAHPFVVVFFLFRCIFQVKASDSERRWR